MESVRLFFAQRGYLEVETPIRVPSVVPEAHIDAFLSENWYLQPSPEICMKVLLSQGYERIFQLAKCFRKNERGKRHLPEFTLLEWYAQGQHYIDFMDECEALIRYVVHQIQSNDPLIYQDNSINILKPWERLTVEAAFDCYASMSLVQALEANAVDEMIAMEIEPNLGFDVPVFLYDYPISQGSNAKAKADNPSVVERFELYIAGIELCNTFTELTDPEQQHIRFNHECQRRIDANKVIYPLPKHFLSALGSIPKAAGAALGIDRLIMLIANTNCIDDVVAFTPEQLC